MDRRERDLRSKAEKLKKLEEKLQRDAKVMSAAELKRLERDIISRKRKIKNAREEYREGTLQRLKYQPCLSMAPSSALRQGLHTTSMRPLARLEDEALSGAILVS